MDIRQLEYIVAIAEEASFTKAAARTHVAQPGISSQVRRLESELGVTLFERTSRRVALTEAGAAVLPHARAALRSFAEIRQTADELAGLRRGHVSVGTMLATRTPRLVALLASFRRQHPAIDVRLRVDRSDVLVAAVADGGLDLALVGIGGEPPAGLAFSPTTDEAIVGAVADGHPAARRRRMSLAELCAEELVVMSDGTGVRSAFDDAVRTEGLSPHIVMEAATPDAVADFAAEGFGIAVIPSTMAAVRPDLHAIEIVRPRLRGRIGFVWADTDGGRPARRAFLTHIRAELWQSGQN